ncbi:regulator of CtrA degradation [Altererythrobacter atlanticus]|uniref:Uncharacterized protein n=1 Tax=Croceibacterium atlanticum TaxID=1267766 RepID=A0A0F7KTJ5_9SPHN|nr:DUF1465 family protein [Croceibacterium atlanticum]AKH42567.1 hypothetical protein WYH_01528 [Croceibacterium atlanticum]MBB5731344.1 regulator of CtrA degradation [Croceibacterium atlanticum]
MSSPADLSPTIIDSLYYEALELADEARCAFDLSGRLEETSENPDLARIALSCEALRATTRMMHSIAWLLNQRAYFAGELSEFQLRRYGRLPPAQEDGDPDQISLLPDDLQEIIGRTSRFYARVERLDHAWRDRYAMKPLAIQRLRERLGAAVMSL